MSYDQLLENAWTIKIKAVNRAIEKKENAPEFARYSGPEGYFADIPDRYKAYAGMPDPAGFDAPIAQLQRVMADISPGQDNTDPVNKLDIYPANVEFSKLVTAGGLIQGWNGDAANAFKKYFLDPFPLVQRNQFILLSVLKAALHATQALWASARKDLDGIAQATIAALDNDPCCDPNKWSFDFTVLSSVASVAGVVVSEVVTDGLAAPLTLAVIDAAASTASSKTPAGISQNQTGNTAIEIVNAMWGGLNKVADDFRTTEDKIRATVDSLDSELTAYQDWFVSARPKLAGANASNVTSSSYLGGHD